MMQAPPPGPCLCRSRPQVLAAYLKAIGFIIPLMDADAAHYYTREVMVVLKREFQTPDEEMKKIVLKVVKQCVGTEGVKPDYLKTDVLPEFFKCFWNRRMALDRWGLMEGGWVQARRDEPSLPSSWFCRQPHFTGLAKCCVSFVLLPGLILIYVSCAAQSLSHVPLPPTTHTSRRNYKALVETTVELANKVGCSEIVSRVVEDLKDESEPYRRMVMETIDKVVSALGSSDIDARLEELLIDGILFAFQEQVGAPVCGGG